MISNNSLTVSIIASELDRLQNLSNLLKSETFNLELIAYYSTVDEAISLLPGKPVDLLFCDLELIGINGFILAHVLKNWYKQIIFLTKSNYHTIQFLQDHNQNYLVFDINNQINPESLIRLNNIIKDLIEDNGLVGIAPFFSNSIKGYNKLAIKGLNRIHLLSIDQIVRVEASKSYCSFYLISNTSILSSRGMYYYELQLAQYGFLRPHKSHLVNLKYAESIDIKSNKLYLIDNSTVPITKEKRDELLLTVASTTFQSR
jgi:two-component system LytT family response regulator